MEGSFALTLRGIEMLLAGGVNVALKSVLMTLNSDEFPAIEKIAQDYGVDFRLDAAIFPSFAGDRSLLDLRIAPDQAVAMEFANPEVLAKTREFLENFRVFESDALYPCSAGTTVFHIDPYGYLYPCLMVRRPSYPILSGNFQQGWDDTISLINEMRLAADSDCRGCKQKMLCGYCPGFFAMETGTEQVPSSYLCTLGKMRSEMIHREISGG